MLEWCPAIVELEAGRCDVDAALNVCNRLPTSCNEKIVVFVMYYS